MNIAFIHGTFPVTSQTFVHRQIEALLAAGHDVTVIARHKGPDLNKVENSRLKVIYSSDVASKKGRLFDLFKVVFSSSLKTPKRIPAYLAALRPRDYLRGAWEAHFASVAVKLGTSSNFDVICCHFGPNGVDAVVLRGAGAIMGKIATIFHGYDVSSYLDEYPNAYERLKVEGDLFLTVNELWKAKLESLNFPKEKIRVHHMGVNCSEIAYAFTPYSEPVRLMSVCRFVEKKGLIYALRALPKVIERFPKLVYTLIGDGPLRAELEAEVKRLGLTANVEFLGMQSNEVVFETLQRSHVFLAPSVTAANGDMEGIPVVIMEAMAQGTPVLSTYHSGIPELIKHGVSGYLAPERDSEAIASGLLELLSSSEKLESVSRAARAKVERDFNNNVLDERFVALLSELLSEL